MEHGDNVNHPLFIQLAKVQDMLKNIGRIVNIQKIPNLLYMQ